MKIRTLLLGTATAFAAVNGAQAADLAVAEPVEYVKVCDAYGAGYFYIPGSDTCLKIGGYVKVMVNFYDKDHSTSYSSPGYTSKWGIVTETSLNATAQSMTDIGLLTGWIDYRAQSDNSSSNGSSRLAYIDSAYLKAGPLKAGFFTNIYNYGGAFGEWGPGADYDAADQSYDQVAFSTSLGGMGFWLGLADQRDSPGGAGLQNGSWPDIIAALTGTAGGFDWKLSAAATDTTLGTGWAAQLAATYTMAGGDAIRGKVAVGNSEGSAYISTTSPFSGGGTVWSALIAGVHYWNSNVNTSISAVYVSDTGSAGSLWNVGVETDWVVAKNFLTGIGVDYVNKTTDTDVWQVQLLAKRTF